MALHYFSEKERRDHLQELIDALSAFLPELERSELYSAQVPVYRQVATEAKRLLTQGIRQEDLSTLSRSVPRLFWLHKEWSPPLEPSAEATERLVEPAWFKRLSPLESRVCAAAERLRTVGEY